jgi:hypothetical protein
MKKPKVNIHPIGKNSPNLFTLTLWIFKSKFAIVSRTKQKTAVVATFKIAPQNGKVEKKLPSLFLDLHQGDQMRLWKKIAFRVCNNPFFVKINT